MIPIQQEPDRIPRGLVRTAGIAIAVSIAASVGAVLLLAGPGRLGEIYRAGSPPPPARLDVSPFQLPTEAELLRAAAAERLRAYGWVDRAAGIIHVPLDVAIALYLAEAAP